MVSQQSPKLLFGVRIPAPVQIMKKKTQWFVITGSLASGKTSVINWLAMHNFRTIPEAARVFIDCEISKKRTLEEIRSDEKAFQKEILKLKIEVENRVPPDQLTFLDRGIPDSFAYAQMIGDSETKEDQFASSLNQYRKIFLLQRLPIYKDYARTEDEIFVEKLQEVIEKVYQDLGYKVILVPVMSVEKRAQFILKKIGISVTV